VVGRRNVPLTIRRATAEDAAAVATIQIHGHRFAYGGILPQPVSDEEWIARRTEAWRPQLAPEHERRTFIAECDGNAIGFVTVGPGEDSPAMGQLFALYLEPDVIGTGVGAALCEAGEGDLRAQGFVVATLWVLEENARARRFYERVGWAFDGTRNDSEREGQLRHELRYRRVL
jgi:ribosomal protein S18 acetylase RimI-like enzyme